MSYTPAEVRALTPVRRTVELRARQEPGLRDVFLCHAWDDRRGVATELHDLLVAEGVSVWFSEKDIVLGQPFLREIDRGLAKSRTGLVLVTPALLKRVDRRGVSDKELSELLARDLLIPVVHETTYDELRKVSPLLASRNGLNTADDSIADVATKIAELVAVEDNLTALPSYRNSPSLSNSRRGSGSFFLLHSAQRVMRRDSTLCCVYVSTS